MSSRQLTLAITTGDADGIGLEVTLKALLSLPIKKKLKYCVYLPFKTHYKFNKLIRSVSLRYNSDSLEFIFSNCSPATWVQDAARGCISGTYHAMITAPLSKELIRRSGLRGIGHTDILKSEAKAKIVHMAFLGDKFNVLLATGHLPLKSVAKNTTVKSLTAAISAANSVRTRLSPTLARKPLALIGLNPHAGENGLIGNEESLIFAKALRHARKKGLRISGPLVPDAAFLKENWNKFSLFISPYHDQGLIPFKMIHGRDSGIHLSVGLPFIRTSVDHGTAKDIFGKNLANPKSMIEAINWAESLAKRTYNGI